MPKKDLKNMRFGRLVAVYEAAYLLKKQTYLWFCKCDCGGSKIVSVNALMCGGIQSCGCLSKIRKNRTPKHGFARKGSSNRTFYQCFIRMHQRCENPKDNSYKNYGAKGIKVCER